LAKRSPQGAGLGYARRYEELRVMGTPKRRKIYLLEAVLFVLTAMTLAGPVYCGGTYQVEVYVRDRTFPGTTLFADNSDPSVSEIVEIDMQGNVVWKYAVPKGIADRTRQRDRIVMDVKRLPNSNILFNVQRAGIFEIDRTGRLVWQHKDAEVSHDADRLPNGNTLYVRGWAAKGGNHVVEVDPMGGIVWAWDGLKDFVNPPIPISRIRGGCMSTGQRGCRTGIRS
jgi:hypothetical protein